MPENSYFQKALSNFTHEVASGGAIRHLTDLGYTARQVADQLDFPTPFARVQQEMWQRLLETEVLLAEEPTGGQKEKVSYVREQDQYGHSSFRRVVETSVSEVPLSWRELRVTGDRGNFSSFLERKIAENGVAGSYVSCDFGILAYREPARYQRVLELLAPDQREYLEGLPWKTARVYHRLETRMRGILLRLYERREYSGICLFLKTGDKLYFE